MKKVLITFVILLMFVITASAEGIADMVINSDTQRELLLATVSDIDDKYIHIDVYNTVGDIHTNDEYVGAVKVNKFQYTYCSEHADKYNTPRIGDNVFLSLVNNNGIYSVDGVAYKTDTVDVRTLNILTPVDMKSKDCITDVVAIAYFIRSNGMDHSFIIQDGIVTVEKDGITTKLYPADVKNPLPIIYVDQSGKNVDSVKQQDVINVNSNPFENVWGTYDDDVVFAKRVLSTGLIFAGIILGMIVVYIHAGRKSKQR